MKKYYVDLEYSSIYVYTERELTEEIVYRLGGECFGLRKCMGECKELTLVEEDKDENLEDITIISNCGDYNIFKGDNYIMNTSYLD